MWSQQIFVALLSLSLTLHHVTAVVNNGPTQNIEESIKSEDKNDKSKTDTADLVAESSESSNRREASILSSYGVPALGSSVGGNIQLPVYGIPNAPSNNIVYPALPPDIPPPPPKLPSAPLYGPPIFGKTYGLPQVNHLPPISKGYGAPYPVKFGASPAYSYNQFSANLNPPKPIYGPPKIKYHKYPPKNFGARPPKPVYGPPITFKENNFGYNKHHLNTNNNYLGVNNFNGLYTGSSLSNNAFSNNLYSGVSSLSHQYGAPILPNKPLLQYGTPNIGTSTQYGLPDKVIASGPSLSAYGPPQPSPNPKPPHPGAAAPPTPPDIKYDGWQPIPGLVSKRPLEETNHLTVEGSSYQDLSPPPLHKDAGDTYRAPPVTLDISHGNSLLNQPGLSDSYGVPLNAVTGTKGVSDSYSAPLGTVTGSGGVVASSGAEAHGAQYNSHGSSHSLSFGSSSQGINFGSDLPSIGTGHGPDIESFKSIEYDITPPQGVPVSIGSSAQQISDAYGAPLASALSGSNLHSSGQSYNSIGSSSQSYKGGFNLNSYKSSSLSSAPVGLVPPSGVYGAPQSSQYGTPLYTNTHGSYKPSIRPGLHTNTGKDSGSSGNSHIAPSSSSYGVPSNSGGAVSYQNVFHGSSNAGVNFQQTSLNIDGGGALPLTSYNVPLGAIDGSYSFSSSHGDNIVSLDYSHPPVSIDLTQAKQHDCNHQSLQAPSLAYGGPSADGYSSSNIATTSHAQTVVPQSTYGEPSFQYGVSDSLHSSSVKTEAKSNSISVENDEEAHGKNYGKSVAESFGPNSELVESQSIDLNNIQLQGNLGSYTLQIQSSEGGSSQVPHTQVLNEGLLQSILQAIEQPGKQNQNAKYPIILQPSIESNSDLSESNQQASEISEVTVDPPKEKTLDNKLDNVDDEETLQLLDTSNIALYYKKDDGMQEVEKQEKPNDSIETSS
ncbi:unnamed protein product [Ceutorhynchus assimilis]|uniref:Enamelin n=1 Tax=Ceutorhynchus assimilis TaxID=467358 RepID=A0A9P0DBI6_9CUCU|nr:unnamed protein product [Ceutorhynchus assimilis]